MKSFVSVTHQNKLCRIMVDVPGIKRNKPNSHVDAFNSIEVQGCFFTQEMTPVNDTFYSMILKNYFNNKLRRLGI